MAFHLNSAGIQLSREEAMRSHTWRRNGGKLRPRATRPYLGPHQNDASRD